MNIVTQAETLYSRARTLKSPRQVEYEAFARITAALVAAGTSLPPGQGAGAAQIIPVTPSMAVALHDNARLWGILAADLTHPDNALPQTLRAGLLSLARFVTAQTDQILAGKPGDLGSLIEVNTSVMRGLRDRSDAG